MSSGNRLFLSKKVKSHVTRYENIAGVGRFSHSCEYWLLVVQFCCLQYLVSPLTRAQTSVSKRQCHVTAAVRICSVKDLLMNVGDQFSKDEVISALLLVEHRNYRVGRDVNPSWFLTYCACQQSLFFRFECSALC